MKLKPTLKQRSLKQTTARDFSGGLNLTDSQFNLTSKFAVAGYNMVPDDNGALQVRWGTRLLGQLNTVLSARIVGMEYYFNRIVAVDADGNVAVVDASGAATLVWSTAIAATLAGTPIGWRATASVSFAHYLGHLIIANGTDKPIIIDNTMSVQYLQDLGTGSNINVPIAKYIMSISNYVVMAGDPNHPGRLYISNAGTSGTWPGDAPPNDAITFDVDKYAPDHVGEIVGLSQYRSLLVVFFSRYIVTLKLGSYSDDALPVHEPIVDDIIESYGAVSHNAIVNVGDQLLFLDTTGISSIKQTIFTTAVTPERVAGLIDIEIQRTMAGLSREFLQRRCFAVYNRVDNRILFFVPTIESDDVTLTMRVYVLTLIRGKTPSWAMFQGWNFQAGCESGEGRILLGNDRQVYRYGSRHEPILSDYEGIRAYDGPPEDAVPVNVYGYGSGTGTLGQGIEFYHELPYNSLGDRTVSKQLAYVSFDTQGASRFTLSLDFDDLKKRSGSLGEAWSDSLLFADGLGWESPSVGSMVNIDFVGGDRGAWSVVLPTQTTPYRPTDNMGLYAVYSHFKFFKMAFSGRSWSHLKIVSVSIHYHQGSIYYG